MRDTVGCSLRKSLPNHAWPLHDRHIVELCVNAEACTIRLRTAHPTRSGPDFADVVFEGVAGYLLRGDALGTILFDIESTDALSLYREYAAEMQQTYAEGGGHLPWVRSDSVAEAFLSTGEVRGYRVSSSIGLYGAVWARQLSLTNG